MDSLKYSIIVHTEPQEKIWYTSNKAKAIQIAKGFSVLLPQTSITVENNVNNGIVFEIVR